MLLSAVPSSFLSLLLFLFISHMRRQGNYNRRCLSHYNSLVAAGAFEASRTSTITIFAISTLILFFLFFLLRGCRWWGLSLSAQIYLSKFRKSNVRILRARCYSFCFHLSVSLFSFLFSCVFVFTVFMPAVSLSLSLPSSIFLERKLFRQRFFRNNNLLSVAGSTKIFLRASKSHRLHPSTSSWTDVPGDSNDLPRKGVSHQVFPVRRPTKSS